MTPRIRLYLNTLAAFALFSATANAASTPARTPAMTQQDSQPQATTKTWCFGRFLIDLPVGATLSGGSYKYNFATVEKPEAMSFESFEKQVEVREANLRAKKHETDPSLLRTAQHPDKNTRLLAYWDKEYSESQVQIEGQHWVNGWRFLLSAKADTPKQTQALARMADRVTRLRPRSADDIPTDPGFCFDGGFVADDEWKSENVDIGFKFPGMPDVSFGVAIFPKDPDKPLLDRKGGALQSLGAFATGVRTLRERDRPIGPFKGQEILMTVPNSGANKGHMFIWETQGEGTLERPFISIEMGSGHSDGKGNAQKTRLSDEQAMALWDSIVSTLRIRPTGPAKTSAIETPRAPLGELAATGRPCPQTGQWRAEEGEVRAMQAGEPMPRTVVTAAPSLWQKLRRESEQATIATVWTLVAYDKPGEPSPAASSALTGDASPSRDAG